MLASISIVVSCTKVFFCVLGNDFSGLGSQLREWSPFKVCFVSEFPSWIIVVSTSKWSLFESGHIYKFDCIYRK